MKKILYCISAAAFTALVSCTTDYIAELPEPGTETVPVTINVGLPSTKRIGENASDMLLKNYQVLVFTESGKFEAASLLYTNNTQTTLNLVPGVKHIWAVANIPSVLADPANEAAFLNLKNEQRFTTYEKISMSAYDTPTITTETQINLSLKHIACKVVLDKVTRSFTNEDYGAIPLVIKRVYLSNVAGDTNYACSAAPTVWYNKQGVVDNGLASAHADMLLNDNINYSIAQNASYDVVHTFYAFPNPTTTDTYNTSWSARHTRLVIECDYNGRTCYYPITLPKASGEDLGTLERNKVYHISQLTLKRPGSTSPENPGDEVESKVAVTFKVTVSDWEGDNSYTEIFE